MQGLAKAGVKPLVLGLAWFASLPLLISKECFLESFIYIYFVSKPRKIDVVVISFVFLLI